MLACTHRNHNTQHLSNGTCLYSGHASPCRFLKVQLELASAWTFLQPSPCLRRCAAPWQLAPARTERSVLVDCARKRSGDQQDQTGQSIPREPRIRVLSVPGVQQFASISTPFAACFCDTCTDQGRDPCACPTTCCRPTQKLRLA